ncbi:MAG: PDZ domain-containing protein [Ginsengibacter sp.]
MKKIFYPALCLAISFAALHTAAAQEDKIRDSKTDEIVIRKKGEKDLKLTIEMKDDDILINGKPLSDFNDSNITVIKRKQIMRHGNNMFMSPRGGNSFYFDDDNDGAARPLLGVTTEKNENGVRITDVSKGTAAESAGLKEGDIITKIDNKKIADPEELMDVVRSYKPKNEVKIYYQRNGKAAETKATLGERKESRMRTFSFNNKDMPAMDGDMMKDFKFEMPPMPKSHFFNFGMPSHKRLGIQIEDTDNDSGARITTIAAGSAAEKAGLKKDDVITEIDGQKVKNTSEVKEQVLENDKSSYTIKAKRGTTDMNFEIKIPKKINSADL